MKNMQLVLSLIVCILSGITLSAQTAVATLSGADTVRQGEMLQLTFSFEDVAVDRFELPEMEV